MASVFVDDIYEVKYYSLYNMGMCGNLDGVWVPINKLRCDYPNSWGTVTDEKITKEFERYYSWIELAIFQKAYK